MTIGQAMEAAVAHHSAGRLAEAEEMYRAILGQMPGNVYAQHYLGLIHINRGQRDQGLGLLRESILADPANIQFRTNLASALLEMGDASGAEAAAREAIVWMPTDAQAQISLALALWRQSRRDEALAAMTKALELQPQRADACQHLGLYLMEMGRTKEAVTYLSRALQLESSPANFANLGTAMLKLGEFEQAASLSAKAASMRPEMGEYHFNSGLALAAAGKQPEAIAALKRAIELRPNHAEAYSKLGTLYKETGQLDLAIQTLRAALTLQPNYPSVYHNLGMVQASMGQVPDAVKSLRKAVEQDPSGLDGHSALVYTLCFCPGYDGAAILREHQEWNRRHVSPLVRLLQPHTNDRDPNRRLRIGYVSPDFREHVLSFYHVPLLSNQDHQNYEIFCYSDVRKPTAVTERIKGYADHWREIAGQSDDEVASLIRSDQIDILVDLTMHMANGRPLLFARKPAPIQVAWAYPGTTGNEAIDYRLTDPYSDPPEQFDQDYSEQSIRLPDSFFIYDPLTGEPAVNALPAQSNGFVTFGCLNNFMKVNEGVLDTWGKVLANVANSRLLLLAPTGSTRQRLLDHFARAGIDSSRVEFVGRQPRPKYLETFNHIDISLDTFPYNGHTTSLDSLWMGVPVVTLIGPTVVGRAGWCLCCNLDRRELAAQSEPQFVQIASDLANDLPRLADVRAKLRSRMEASPLMNGKRFAAGVEQVYRDIWQRRTGRE